MDNKLVCKFEALFDITMEAAHLTQTGQINVEDSRELFDTCLSLAEKFEGRYTEEDFYIRDYMTLVAEFAEAELLAHYGNM